MGWSIGYDSNWGRDIGYGVVAFCDEPGCDEVIDRGLSYVCCGQEPHGGEYGCGLFFCGKHSGKNGDNYAEERCGHADYDAKPDHPRWIRHKLMHSSWAAWRAENMDFVNEHSHLIGGGGGKWSEDEKCECCESPDVHHHDVEGVPLCVRCFQELSAMEATEVAATQEPGESAGSLSDQEGKKHG